MAATLPTRKFHMLVTKWHFSLNPGPFNMKEHVLITIFANAGAGSVHAIHILSMANVFYKHHLNFTVALIVVLTTQILGFGWAGLFRKHLVEPAAMLWPSNLVQVSLFRALHENDKRPQVKRKVDPSDTTTPRLTCRETVPHAQGWLDIWQLSRSAFKPEKADIHTRLMRNYKEVPQSWFLGIFIITVGAATYACEIYKEKLQLPWWGILLACMIAFIFTLPIGIIMATTNQAPAISIITEYIIGYLYPGRPLANICFKVYGYISMTQALEFLQDFKLGHYMKIPPRTMFMAQLVGTLVASISYLGTAWYMIKNIPNICDTTMLPSNSPWTCPADHVFYDASVIWGLIGPRRIFGDLGLYSAMNWFFLIGAVAPVSEWLLCRAYPNKKWIRLINMPVLIAATGMMPPATPVNFTSWCLVGFLFSFVIFRYRKAWWQPYNYVLSGGLDAGLAFMGIMLYLCLGMWNISLHWWGENLDNCPLASCPTAVGI